MDYSKHTPGPWSVRCAPNHWMVDAGFRTGNIATINNGRVQQKHNAHLIAAAPEMLEALKMARECIAWCRKHHPDAQKGEGVPAEAFIDAAIAKAEGR